MLVVFVVLDELTVFVRFVELVVSVVRAALLVFTMPNVDVLAEFSVHGSVNTDPMSPPRLLLLPLATSSAFPMATPMKLQVALEFSEFVLEPRACSADISDKAANKSLLHGETAHSNLFITNKQPTSATGNN